MPIDTVEQHAVPKGFMERGELEQLFSKDLDGSCQDLGILRKYGQVADQVEVSGLNRAGLSREASHDDFRQGGV